jgi:hypothetical protein
MDRPDPSAQRLRSRLGRRLLVAAVLGPAIGLAIGGVIATIAIGTWNVATTMVLVGTVVGCTLLALLWAGYSSLESPDPGMEPSDTQRPIADRSDLVRRESDAGLPGSPDG